VESTTGIHPSHAGCGARSAPLRIRVGGWEQTQPRRQRRRRVTIHCRSATSGRAPHRRREGDAPKARRRSPRSFRAEVEPVVRATSPLRECRHSPKDRWTHQPVDLPSGCEHRDPPSQCGVRGALAPSAIPAAERPAEDSGLRRRRVPTAGWAGTNKTSPATPKASHDPLPLGDLGTRATPTTRGRRPKGQSPQGEGSAPRSLYLGTGKATPVGRSSSRGGDKNSRGVFSPRPYLRARNAGVSPRQPPFRRRKRTPSLRRVRTINVRATHRRADLRSTDLRRDPGGKTR
jgi:hypothetical protein